jgi:vesicle coat complex subunit
MKQKKTTGAFYDEVSDLKVALSDTNLDVRRGAIRRIISGMTLGKDVSLLFPLVIKNMETSNMELKKLVYLYIINYARAYPDASVMAVNSFLKDA